LDVLLNGDTDFGGPEAGERREGALLIEGLRLIRGPPLTEACTRVQCNHQRIRINGTLKQSEEVVKVRRPLGVEHDDINHTKCGTDGSGFDCDADQTLNNRIHSLESSLALVEEEEKEGSDKDICEHGQTDPCVRDRDELRVVRRIGQDGGQNTPYNTTGALCQ